MFLGVVRAILRTNYFQTGPTKAASHLSFKLDPSELRWLPQPRPASRSSSTRRARRACTSAAAPWRAAGSAGRTGEDFRTEVLGLMKAQMVKNAVIVPVGAKGGSW